MEGAIIKSYASSGHERMIRVSNICRDMKEGNELCSRRFETLGNCRLKCWTGAIQRGRQLLRRNYLIGLNTLNDTHSQKYVKRYKKTQDLEIHITLPVLT